MSVAEAAKHLHLSDQQVRRLARNDGLAAQQLGGQWLISRPDVRHRAARPPGPGRPLSAEMAWLVLSLLDGLAAHDPDVGDKALAAALARVEDRKVRHRVRHLLADAPPAQRWHHWLGRRADRRRIRVHPGVVDRLAADARISVGGSAAAAASGVGLGGGSPERLYVAAADYRAVLKAYRAQPAPDGNIELLVIPPGVPQWLRPAGGETVPAAVAIVDLLDSDDARERHLAANYVRQVRRHAERRFVRQ